MTEPVDLTAVPIEDIRKELARRYAGVALVTLEMIPRLPGSSEPAFMLDTSFTAVRGIPSPALAGCTRQLALELEAFSTRITKPI